MPTWSPANVRMHVGSGRLLAYSPAESKLLANLESSGYAIEKIASAKDYLSAIYDTPPDLVLLPLTSPDSEKILVELVSFDAHPPVLVFGESNDAALASKFMRAGADEYYLATAEENALLGVLVDRTISIHRDLDALKIENSDLQTELDHISHDTDAAFAVQQKLLPDPQMFGDVSFSYHLVPRAGMSGDSANCFALSDGRLLFYLADVAGHGVLGGVVTTALTVTAKTMSDPGFESAGQSSSDLLSWFNRAMLALELEQHVTMFLGVIDSKTSTLEYSSAAHFPGTILCQNDTCQYLELGGLPLGVTETIYASEVVQLSPAFEMVLFSDGVLEILPEIGLKKRENHLISLVESGFRSISALSAELDLEGRTEVPDDIAVLTLRRNLP